jgi:hypothetical protein
MSTLNLTKYSAYNHYYCPDSFVFSMDSYQRRPFNRHLLLTFISKLELDPNLILNHPNLPSVLAYGTMGA